MRSIVLDAGTLTDDAWEPFGWIPVPDTDPRDQERTYEFLWGDVHVNLISHTADEVEHTDRGPVCAVMYRHDTHTQTLMPLNVDSVVAVAPADVDFSEPAHLEAVRAFRLRPLDCFALYRGTWHWGPFPVGSEAVRMFNVQGKRYAEDNTSVDLAARAGAVFEVLS
ncbi:MAG: ureidoglycolate lyase [Acidimicrobiia bacterium]